MKKQIIISLTALLFVSVYAVVQIGSTGAASHADVSFANDIQPILESRCGSCHMGEFTSADLHMDTHEELMIGSESGPVIIPGNAKDSLLVEKISKGEMPKRGPKLTPAQIQIITDWINAGAQND
jgi:hypothetical protein